MGRSRKADFSVTFEFETRQPETLRGVVEGASASSLTAKAVRAAYRAIKPRNYTSVVALVADLGTLGVKDGQ